MGQKGIFIRQYVDTDQQGCQHLNQTRDLRLLAQDNGSIISVSDAVTGYPGHTGRSAHERCEMLTAFAKRKRSGGLVCG